MNEGKHEKSTSFVMSVYAHLGKCAGTILTDGDGSFFSKTHKLRIKDPHYLAQCWRNNVEGKSALEYRAGSEAIAKELKKAVMTSFSYPIDF